MSVISKTEIISPAAPIKASPSLFGKKGPSSHNPPTTKSFGEFLAPLETSSNFYIGDPLTQGNTALMRQQITEPHLYLVEENSIEEDLQTEDEEDALLNDVPSTDTSSLLNQEALFSGALVSSVTMAPLSFLSLIK